MIRPHGLAGEVVVKLVTNRLERVQPGACLRASDEDLRVLRSRPFKDRWLVFFKGVETLEAADRLRGVSLFADAIDDPEALWVHELVGAQVASAVGEVIGRVKAVVANPASDLLELEDGRLVPVRFVTRRSPGLVVVDVPAGLLD